MVNVSLEWNVAIKSLCVGASSYILCDNETALNIGGTYQISIQSSVNTGFVKAFLDRASCLQLLLINKEESGWIMCRIN